MKIIWSRKLNGDFGAITSGAIFCLFIFATSAFSQSKPLEGGVEQSQVTVVPQVAPSLPQQNMIPLNINQQQFQGQVQQGQNAVSSPMRPLQQSVQQNNFNAQQGFLQGQQSCAPPTMLQGQTMQSPPQKNFQMAGVSGGEEAFGCLGCVIDKFGTVENVYPESDLNRYQIVPGDRVLGINGHFFDGKTFPSECLGVPGTMIYLDILHMGNPIQASVHRVDSRDLAGRASYYKHWADKTRRW